MLKLNTLFPPPVHLSIHLRVSRPLLIGKMWSGGVHLVALVRAGAVVEVEVSEIPDAGADNTAEGSAAASSAAVRCKVRSRSARGTYEGGGERWRDGEAVLVNGASGTLIRAQGRNGVVKAVEQGI